MAATVTGKRRLGPWIVGAGIAFSIFLGAAVVAWIWLPRWAPEWVMSHSPWTWPALRAGAVMRRPGTTFDPGMEYQRDWETAEIPTLIQALDDGTVRVSAIAALGVLDDPRAFHQVARALATDPDRKVRIAAAVGLRYAHRGEAAAVLMDGLHDVDSDVRGEVMDSLGRVANPDCIPGLMDFMSHCLPAERVVVVDVLAQIIDPRVSGLLIGLLADSDKHVRVMAAHALSRHPGPGVVAALEPLLSDSYGEVREWSASTLLDLDDPDSSRVLAAYVIKALDLPSDDAISLKKMVRLLARRSDPAVVATVYVALADPDRRDVGEAAAEALLEYRTATDLPRLSPALASSVAEVRINALVVCAGWKGWEQVANALRDDDPRVRGRALRLLAESMHDDKAELHHLAEMIPLLDDSDKVVRLTAIWALGLTRDGSAVDPLLRLLASTTDEELRIPARDALRTAFMLTPDQRAMLSRVAVTATKP